MISLRFLFTAKMNPSPQFDSEMLIQTMDKVERWINANVRTGKLESPYALADQRGWMGIFSVNTMEELNDMIQEEPAALFEEIEVHPLAEIHHALAKMKEMVH